MLRRTSDVEGFALAARDGELGRAKDFYFDDESWTVRYLVADTGKWLVSRQVLISPHALRSFHDKEKVLEVDLTKEQIENSPPIDEDMPVSRQFEKEYFRYYNYPYYWQDAGMWGPLPRTGESYGQVTGPFQQTWPPKAQRPPGDPHLRSAKEVTGYHIQARDGEIGHVEDFVIDDENWTVRYVVVDTVNWWPGKKVLVAPSWAHKVDWHQSKLHLNLEREQVRAAPEYDVSKPISRKYEATLLAHYGRKQYWLGEAA